MAADSNATVSIGGVHESIPDATPTFNLQRYFRLLSLGAFAVAVIVILVAYSALETRKLLQFQSAIGNFVTRVASYSLWTGHGAPVGEMTQEQLIQWTTSYRYQVFDEAIRSATHRLGIAKVKAYSAAGQTIYSTNQSEVGQTTEPSVSLQRALAGETVTTLEGKRSWAQTLSWSSDSTLVSIYLPIRDDVDGQILHVFEIYLDMSHSLNEVRSLQMQIALVTVLVCAALYAFLSLVVRQAESNIQKERRVRLLREDALHQAVCRDGLTGLLNRIGFQSALEEIVALCIRNDRRAAVLFIDLDRFKQVNDTLGHAEGDKLLKSLAAAWKLSLRKGEELYRIGGDEFVLIVPDISNDHGLLHVAQRLRDTVSDYMRTSKLTVDIDASIGISMIPADGRSADEVVRHADAAMYHIKHSSRGGIAFFDQSMTSRMQERAQLEKELTLAVSKGEFVLNYQGRWSALDRKLVGVEALIRWQHPVRGLVGPQFFMPTLERTHLIEEVERWVVTSACHQVAAWSGTPMEGVRVSVNLSPGQFQNEAAVDYIIDLVRELKLPAGSLEIELTESTFVENAEVVQSTIRALRQCGISVAIDDFGMGFSSLNHLRQFQVDILKVDKAFCDDVCRSRRSRALAIAIVKMAIALEVKVVVEGIEHEEQALFFEQLGCDELQGYLFHRPGPVETLLALVDGHSRTQTPPQSLHLPKADHQPGVVQTES